MKTKLEFNQIQTWVHDRAEQLGIKQKDEKLGMLIEILRMAVTDKDYRKQVAAEAATMPKT